MRREDDGLLRTCYRWSFHFHSSVSEEGSIFWQYFAAITAKWNGLDIYIYFGGDAGLCVPMEVPRHIIVVGAWCERRFVHVDLGRDDSFALALLLIR